MALNLGPLNVLLNLKGAKQFTQGATEATSAISSLGKSLVGLGALYQISSSVMEATQVFAEFERGMVRVGAVTNSLGSTAFAGLTERAQELATTTEFTARQVGDAMGFMGMAGMSTNAIYEATPAVLQLASAGMIDVAKAADVVTNIMAGYGMKTEQLTEANNVLVATFTGSNTSIESLGQSFKYVGSVAKNAGVSFKDAAAVIGLMGNAGIQADMAGTALRGTIIKLLDPTDEGAKIMRQYGINVLDSSGKLKSMSEIFRQFEPIAGDSAKMIELFGLRAGPGFQAALSQGTAALDKLTKKIEEAGNIAERISEAQLDTLDGKIKIMKSNIEAAQIAFGQGLAPASEAFVAALSKAAEFAKYIADVISFATKQEADTSEVEAKMTTLAAQRAKATQQLIGLQKAIAGGYADVFMQEKLTGFVQQGISPEGAIGGLEMQIDELTHQIASFSKLFGVKRPGMPTPMAPTVAPPVEMTDKERKKQFEAAAQAYRFEVAPTDFQSAAGGIVDVLADIGYAGAIATKASVEAAFAPSVVGNIMSPLGNATRDQALASEMAAQALHRAALQATATASEIRSFGALLGDATAAMKGNTVGATFGAAAASTLGSMIGSAIAPGIGGAIGGEIGQIVGQTFGPMFDAVNETTDVFRGFVQNWNATAAALFAPILVGLGPALAAMAEYQRTVAIPVLTFLGDVIGAVAWMFSEMSVVGQNFMIWMENLTRGDDNKIPYIVGKTFEQYMQEVEETRRKVLEALNDETVTTTERFRELNEELTNVPIGVKRLRALQYNATRGAAAFPGRFNAPAFGA